MKHSPVRLLALLGAASSILASSPVNARDVVVELYQSQGCSDCPPAEANLNAIANHPGVIALSFGVTYWDQLGWKDTFAQPKFTARQWSYAHALHHADVFTPQVIVDGQRDGVGADPAEFARLVHSTSQAAGAPALILTSKTVTVGAGPVPHQAADVWLVRYDPRTIQVPIRAGENGGKTLPHTNIVHELVRVGGWTGSLTTLPLPAPSNPILRTAILVQAPGGGPILAAIEG